MENQPNISLSHSVYLLRLHIVLVTKYRRKVFTGQMLKYAEKTFAGILRDWRCSLIEFGGEEDHVHLLVDIHPALNISTLVNNLKSASSRRLRNKFAGRIRKFYWKPVFWHRAYYVGSVGTVTLDTIKRYVEQQGTKEKPRKVLPLSA
ncbi:MAG TPA: IS200/IS605 family transposase [Nitrospirota bacterium]|nr:IS200/IS605 family transposase [Nitrospirota bacterium]